MRVDEPTDGRNSNRTVSLVVDPTRNRDGSTTGTSSPNQPEPARIRTNPPEFHLRITMQDATTTGLQRLLDERAIIDTTIAYCWAIDTRRWDVLRDRVFLADATASLGSPLEGVERIVARIDFALSPLDTSQHMISNHDVTIDGDTATSRCYFHAQHVRRGAEGGPNYIVAGIYADDFLRTSAGWRIKHRTLTVLWTDGNMKVVRP